MLGILALLAAIPVAVGIERYSVRKRSEDVFGSPEFSSIANNPYLSTEEKLQRLRWADEDQYLAQGKKRWETAYELNPDELPITSIVMNRVPSELHEKFREFVWRCCAGADRGIRGGFEMIYKDELDLGMMDGWQTYDTKEYIDLRRKEESMLRFFAFNFMYDYSWITPPLDVDKLYDLPEDWTGPEGGDKYCVQGWLENFGYAQYTWDEYERAYKIEHKEDPNATSYRQEIRRKHNLEK